MIGGLAGVLAPTFQFTSPAEPIIPGARSDGFIRALTHPSLTTYSDFLGYEQPRPKAPFVYANAWGNNVGLLLPFFVYAWATSPRLWQRIATPLVLVAVMIPVAYSLNRGLWLGLCLLILYCGVAMARSGRLAALSALTVCTIVTTIVLIASPLWATIMLRLETPHSNERRETVAAVVVEETWRGLPCWLRNDPPCCRQLRIDRRWQHD